MSNEPNQFGLDTETPCPNGLRDDLRGLYDARANVPRHVDEAVCSAAQAKFVRLRRRRLILRLVPAAAAAAAVVTGAILWGFRGETPPTASPAIVATPHQSVTNPQDIDGSGRVDVLDALALARRVEAGKSQAKWDFNRDGIVDRKDADRIAVAAVQLGEGA